MLNRQQIREWLLSTISSMNPGERLPTNRELSVLWGCHPRSVRRILAAPEFREHLNGIPGRGVFKAGALPSPSPNISAPKPSSAQHVAALLRAEISLGTIKRSHALPQPKYLTIRYKISRGTVLGAYGILADEGLVEKIGRQYWVGGFTPWTEPSVGREVMLVALAADLPRIFTTDRMRFAYTRCEHELRSCGLLLSCRSWEEFCSCYDKWSGTPPPIRGIIFHHRVVSHLADALMERIPKLIALGAGPVLIDTVSRAPRMSDIVHCQVISRGNINTVQARALARYVGDHVDRPVTFVTELEASMKPYRQYLLRYAKFFLELAEKNAFNRPLQWCILTHGSGITAEHFLSECRIEEADYLSYISGKYRGLSAVDFLFDLIRIAPDFQSCLDNNGNPQLWICATDRIAATVLDTCDRRQIAVPSAAAVISLDDEQAIIHRGVSSCAPDWERIGYLMAHALIEDFPLKKTAKGFIRTLCPVVERWTTPPHWRLGDHGKSTM